MSALLKTLNKRQREAVLYEDGGVLVLAGAGTGKTRVLTGRIIHLLANKLAKPNEILAVTFTNKAAAEMKTRINAALTTAPQGLMLGTFHGICHRLLRVHAQTAGLEKNFQILDNADQLAFLRRLMRDNEINEMRFPVADVRAYIGAAKERGLRAAETAPQGEYNKGLTEIYAMYEEACRNENRVDFSELLLAVVELLQSDKDLRRHYANRFKYILVDELQDTNRQQFDWLSLLDSGKNKFFGVGDDDQSIYGFRGAEPAIMQEFQSRLRAKKLIRLEENYRSVRKILEIANRLISGNSNRLGKTLTSSLGEGDLVEIIPADTDEGEARIVAQMVLTHIRDGGNSGETAVLYRTNSQGRLFEREFINHNLPYRVYGGTRFYERLEVKQALAYMRLISDNDEDALRRAVKIPPRGIGEKTLATLAENGDMFAAIENSTQKSVSTFRRVLADLREPQDSLAETIRNMLEKSGLITHYQAKPKDADRVENLRELVSAAAQFEEEYDSAEAETDDVLTAFLASASLQEGGEDGTGAQVVSLMTVHAAKGLEFPRVFVVGMEEGLFPHVQSLVGERNLEEERRLLYVAVTRAQQHLSLHFSHSRMLYGERKPCEPSRFLRELPEECLVDNGWAKKPKDHTAEEVEEKRVIAALPPPPKIRSDHKGYRTGDHVRHKKYGTGVVLQRRNSGGEEEIVVFFKKPGVGKKTFKTALAKLEKV